MGGADLGPHIAEEDSRCACWARQCQGRWPPRQVRHQEHSPSARCGLSPCGFGIGFIRCKPWHKKYRPKCGRPAQPWGTPLRAPSRYFCPSSLLRRSRAAASEKAHLRWALPMFWPEVPKRLPGRFFRTLAEATIRGGTASAAPAPGCPDRRAVRLPGAAAATHRDADGRTEPP